MKTISFIERSSRATKTVRGWGPGRGAGCGSGVIISSEIEEASKTEGELAVVLTVVRRGRGRGRGVTIPSAIDEVAETGKESAVEVQRGRSRVQPAQHGYSYV